MDSTGLKTSAPALTGAVARPALVATLAGAGGAAQWLAAPSGTGKSMLAAAYAAACGRRCIWYRLDARDNDPAYFYAHFSDAVATGGATMALPRLAAEDRAESLAFAGRYRAALAEQLSAPTLFVLDDVHTVGAGWLLDTLAQWADAGVPGSEWLFVAEQSPPAAFYGALSRRTLQLRNDVPLAFTADECHALATSLRLAGMEGQRLADLTAGHAGALVIACQVLRGGDGGSADAVMAGVHRELVDRMLARMLPNERTLLLRTAFVDAISPALARDLAGAAAALELAPLAARGLLRHVRSADGEYYESHGLLRDGLRAGLRATSTGAALRTLLVESADALLAQGAVDAAIAICIEAGDSDRALDLLEGRARRYARDAQADLLLAVIARLDSAAVCARPWLCFWTGRALLGIDEETARQWFERAYAAFASAQDAAGMRTAAASVITTFVLEYGDIRTLDAWLARYRTAGGDLDVAAGAPHEATLCVGMICAALTIGAHAEGVDATRLTGRVQALLDERDAWYVRDQSLEAARLLIDHACVLGTYEQAQALVAATRAHAEDPQASALARGRWYISAACAFFEDDKAERAAEYLGHAEVLAAGSGSRRLLFELGMNNVDAALKRRNLDDAAGHLASMEAALDSATLAQRAEFSRLCARVQLSKGNAQQGLRWAQNAWRDAQLAGFSGSHARAFRVECTYALAANGRYVEAIAMITPDSDDMQGMQRAVPEAIAGYLRFIESGMVDNETLREALHTAAEHGLVHLLARAGNLLPRICSHALDHGIEPAFVRRVIATHAMAPPEDAGPAWPWPVRVHTLGGFELEVAGQRYRPSHKAADKPLELLKLLICCQAMGRQSVDKDWIGERLWPDADAGNARKSLDMAVSRLRRLLDHDAAITALEGRLQLSPSHVWTDVGALMRARSSMAMHRDGRAAGHHVARGAAQAALERLLANFRGAFLADDDALPWLVAGREAVSGAVRDALLAADLLLAGEDDERLCAALARACTADPTSEHLARALMRACMRQSQHAEALRAYRRLREMLSIVLGVAPSPETERLRATIYAGAESGHASQLPAAPNAA